MRARDPHEVHRVATPLELLFDLTFVVAVAAAVPELAHAIVENHPIEGLIGFLLVFFGIWWAWMNFTWFASAFDCDDALYRVLTMVQMAGVLVLAIGWFAPLRSAADWSAMLRRAAPMIGATIAVAMVAALGLGFVRFDPRWTPLFWVWAPINLLLTCFSEEALFRGFLQRELGMALEGRAYAAATAEIHFLYLCRRQDLLWWSGGDYAAFDEN